MGKQITCIGEYIVYLAMKRNIKYWVVAFSKRGRIVSRHASYELAIAAAERHEENRRAWKNKPIQEASHE